MRDKVLFVDDEAAVLDGFQRNLRNDFAVFTAVGGELGLAALRSSGPFPVVVTDMRMPGMSGVEFLAGVRARAPETVRILLTGHADLNAAIDAVNRGNIFRFLTKPCEKRILIEAIQKGLEQYHAITAEKELVKRAEMIARSRSEWDRTDIEQAAGFQGLAGLPGPNEAKEAIGALLGKDPQSCVVLLKLTLFATIEERYGEKTAGEYLKSAVEFLSKTLRPGDRLFHWSKDVLMAIVHRHISPPALRMEFSRLLMDRHEHLADINGRKVMISISMAFDLLPVSRFTSVDQMLAAFDAKLVGTI